jgi:hypothetical protein
MKCKFSTENKSPHVEDINSDLKQQFHWCPPTWAGGLVEPSVNTVACSSLRQRRHGTGAET